jgi:predicted  nucleic acid-binding Zn-ribbon protein
MNPSNKSLFQIQSELMSLFNAIEEAEGEITQEQSEQLTITRGELQQKGLNYVHYIKKLEQDLELAKVYEEQIKSWKNKKTKMIERLKDALLDAVKIHGTIETDIFKISTRKSESVEVNDEQIIPMYYFSSKLVKTLDKAKVKEDIKKGETIPGVELRENKNLSIK